jgi:hypothetical protein
MATLATLQDPWRILTFPMGDRYCLPALSSNGEKHYMMKKALIFCIGFTTAFTMSGVAATVPSALPRHTLSYSPSLENVSVGLFAATGMRSVVGDNSSAEISLESETAGVMIGYDFASWLTGFTTLGSGRIRKEEDNAYADQGFRGSLGLSANLWRTDLTHPEFLEGTISFKTVMEYSQLTSSGTKADYEWNELSVSFPLSYEMFTSYGEFESDQIFSLVLYAGPAYSGVDGSITGSSRDVSFSEADAIGITTGADLYFADNLALGGQFRIFEDTEVSVSLFYHF